MVYLKQEHPRKADDESAKSVTKLQLQDPELSVSLSSSKGEGPEEKFTVKSHAVQLQKQELENVDPSFSIRKMGRNFANTVRSHVSAVTRTTSQANTAAGDFDLAQGIKDNAKQPGVKHSNKNWGSRQLSKLRNFFVSRSNVPDLRSGESEQTLASTSTLGSSTNLTSNATHCVSCGDDNNPGNIGRAPCGHGYCHDCLQNLVETAITDESFFPPRCCRQPISFKTIRKFLTSELVQALINKQAEFETPNKTYCSVQTCSAFIGSGNIVDDVAVVVALNFATSVDCHGRPALVRNGTNIDLLSMRTWLLVVTDCARAIEPH
ncbi:hypothetical protein VE03_09900 [Pseudogymnoascus sp. 23342-1-I1]|nr:hypothetical protein VE03_09900 [Pseudogymnoascus sp. 23342-1-I1]